jgi:hypothetical protein
MGRYYEILLLGAKKYKNIWLNDWSEKKQLAK